MPNKVGSDFPTYQRPDWLYHASPYPIESHINLCVNATSVSEKREPLVFAGNNILGANAYALKTEGCITIRTLWEGQKAAGLLYLHHSRDKFYEQNPQGYIYPVKSDYFEPVIGDDGHITGEWISRTPVPVDPSKTIRLEGIDSVMQEGVQFFFLSRQPSMEEQKKINNSSVDNYAVLIKKGLLIWENQLRGIAPLPRLLDALGPHHRQHVGNYLIG